MLKDLKVDLYEHGILTNIESIRHAKFYLHSFTLRAYGLTEYSILVDSSPQLTSLRFKYIRTMTSSQLYELRRLRSVKHFTISFLKGKGYENIGSMSLESLTHCKVYPMDFIQMISGSPHLKKLCFKSTDILICFKFVQHA